MNKKVRIIVTVISDLVTDQRVHKVCTTLSNNGYDVLLIGAKRKGSLPLSKRNYNAERIHLIFQKKFWFYAEFNTRLFLKLLFTRCHILLGNDLDVMPATFLASKLKRKALVYDTHEYYLGMPELNGRPFIKNVWKKIEEYIFPRLTYAYTICKSFCDLYYKDYGKSLWYIRNVPFLQYEETNQFEKEKFEIDKKIPGGKNILLFQGAGINVDRGVEELILSMCYIDPSRFHLIVVGGGDIFETIIDIVNQKKLNDRITIIQKVPFEVLKHITKKAALGFTLDKPNNINHIYGLPNKIFDYLHAGVPVLSTRLIELENIITKYKVGAFLENNDPKHIADTVTVIFENPQLLETWKANTKRVKQEMNWENEEKILLKIFEKVCKESGFIHGA